MSLLIDDLDNDNVDDKHNQAPNVVVRLGGEEFALVMIGDKKEEIHGVGEVTNSWIIVRRLSHCALLLK